MRQYFDHMFWRELAIFCVVIAVVLVGIQALSQYNERTYGPSPVGDSQRAYTEEQTQ